MRESDLSEFSALLDAVCGLLSRGTYTPNATNTALWFRALAAYPLSDVRGAFDAHVKDPQRGRFVPTPADILAQIQGLTEQDGRPGAEEAWATALRCADEADTIVWTEEMAQAWGVAKPVLDGGDKVGARMAFREAYERLVTEARQKRAPAQWSASLGHDAARRYTAIQQAIDAGRLPRTELPALPMPERPLLTLVSKATDEVRDSLKAMADAMRARQDDEYVPSASAVAIQRTMALKAEAARLVAERGAA